MEPMDEVMDVAMENVGKEYMPDMMNVRKFMSLPEDERMVYLTLMNIQGFRSVIMETLRAENIIVSRRDYNIDKVTE